jgi:peptidoglycan/LPS O-acetylase OafA/YrhL
MRFLNPKTHGIIDWLIVTFLIVSPKLLEMEKKATNFTYALAVIYFVLTVATNYKAGIARVIPFFAHGVFELMFGVAMIIAGYSYFNRDPFGHILFVWFGGFILVFWLFTDYEKPKKTKIARRKIAL